MSTIKWIDGLGYFFNEDCPLESECLSFGDCHLCEIDDALKDQILLQIKEIKTIKRIK